MSQQMEKDQETQPNCFHAVVRGRVQRVGFRVFTREAAQRNSVTGWVRNLPNGRVEIFAEGSELNLTEFLTDLYRGPVMGHVEDIDLHWKQSEQQHSEFEILR